MRFSLIAVCSLLAAATGAPTAEKSHAVHERRQNLPAQWKRSAKIHGDSYLPMRIALAQSNLDRADEFLMDVSHPESPNFGKHVCMASILSPPIQKLHEMRDIENIHFLRVSQGRYIYISW